MKNKLIKAFLLCAATLSTFVACGGNNKSDEAMATEAIAMATYVGEVDLNNVNGQFSLVGQAVIARALDESDDSLETIAITWTADVADKWDLQVNAAQGVVMATPVQGEDPYEFTLTASVKVGKVTKTKEIKGTVLAKTNEDDGITKISELSEELLNTMVTVEGYAFSHPKKQGQGFYLTDGASFVFVYDGAKNVVTKGNKVKVTGNFVKYGTYSQMYQIDCGSKVTGATVTITDTATNELPVDGATEFDLNNSSTFSKTRLGVAGELKVYHVKSYLVGYVNGYGNPAYELCTTSDGSGKYIAWYPQSTDCFSLYGAEYGTFDTSAPTTHKEGIVNDGQLHDFYFVIYDADMEDDNVTFKKYRFIPVCYR